MCQYVAIDNILRPDLQGMKESVFVCPITKLSITRYHKSESGSLLKQDKNLLGDHAKTAEDRLEVLDLPRL